MKKLLCGLIISVLMLNINSIKAESKNINCNAPVKASITRSPQTIDNLVRNYKNDVKIVFSDIDKTVIVVEGEKFSVTPSKNLIKAVKKLKKANIPLIFATGRSYGEAAEVIKKIGSDNAYIVTQQGAEIFNSKGQLIYQSSINYTDAIAMLNEIECYMSQSKMDSKVLVFVGGKSYAKGDFKIPSKWEKSVIIKSYGELGQDSMVSKILIYEANPDRLKLLQADLKKKFPNFPIDLGTSVFCEINAPNVSKGTAVKIIAQKFNVDLKNSAVIGDSENDLSMVSEVKKSGGLTICVGNAMSALKEKCDYMTLSVNDDGFAKAMDIILENNAFLKSRK